jgi:amidase
MSGSDLCFAGITELSARIGRGELSPVDLTRDFLDRIAALDGRLHAYATLTGELALEQARQAEAEIGRGQRRSPLHGIPLAVKDLYFTRGVKTSAGMPLHGDFVPDYDATVVERLHAAGAVLLGKLQLTEGAMAQHHPDITPPVNPWRADLWTGVSSSGSGVATAAGLCAASLGSDTGGSIRFPCAMNGVTGIKPTWGRVSRHGVFALAPRLDHVGPMARSAEDAGHLLRAISGADAHDPTASNAPVPDYLAAEPSVRGLRIGVDEQAVFESVDAHVEAAMRGVVEVLRDLGARVTALRLPESGALAEGWGAYCAAAAAVVHEQTFPSRADAYGPSLRDFLEGGLRVPGTLLARLELEARVFAGRLVGCFDEVDLLLVPVIPMAGLTLQAAAAATASEEGIAMAIRFTAPFDFSGSPTITLPAGFDPPGVPVAFQLVAPHLGEERLVAAGRAYQSSTDWHLRRPSELPD